MHASTQTEELGAVDEAGAVDAPTQPLLTATGQQCAACGEALAPDQQYCLRCGERRGPSRMPSLDLLNQTRALAPASMATGPPRPMRMSSSTTLIAGVGTLLLALGIGVLIGRSGDTTSTGRQASAVQVVTVPGAGAAAAPAATAAAAGAKAAKSAKAAPSTSASSAVTGASVVKPKKNAPPPTKVVKVGSPGSGPGYQHGHFTGNFFGQ